MIDISKARSEGEAHQLKLARIAELENELAALRQRLEQAEKIIEPFAEIYRVSKLNVEDLSSPFYGHLRAAAEYKAQWMAEKPQTDCPMCQCHEALKRAERIIDEMPAIGSEFYDDIAAQLVNDLSTAADSFKDMCE